MRNIASFMVGVLAAASAFATQDCVDFQRAARARTDARLPCDTPEVVGAKRRCLEELRAGEGSIDGALDAGKKARDAGRQSEGRAQKLCDDAKADERRDPERARQAYSDAVSDAAAAERDDTRCLRSTADASAGWDTYTANRRAFESADLSCRPKDKLPPELKDRAAEVVAVDRACREGLGRARDLRSRANRGIDAIDHAPKDGDEDRH